MIKLQLKEQGVGGVVEDKIIKVTMLKHPTNEDWK